MPYMRKVRFPFFFLKGMVLRTELEASEEGVQKAGYEETHPLILNEELWHRPATGITIKTICILPNDDENCAIKPMNCPGGMLA